MKSTSCSFPAGSGIPACNLFDKLQQENESSKDAFQKLCLSSNM